MKFLLDEMLPPTTCGVLRELGHNATSVRDAGLTGVRDDAVFDRAVHEGRVIVTENFADYSILADQRLARGAPCVPVVFVRKADLPRAGALPARLGRRLDAWARANPEPYIGPHWL